MALCVRYNRSAVDPWIGAPLRIDLSISLCRRPAPSFHHAIQPQVHHHPRAQEAPSPCSKNGWIVHPPRFPRGYHTHTAKHLHSHRSYASHPSTPKARSIPQPGRGRRRWSICRHPAANRPCTTRSKQFSGAALSASQTASRFLPLRLLCRPHMTALPACTYTTYTYMHMSIAAQRSSCDEVEHHSPSNLLTCKLLQGVVIAIAVPVVLGRFLKERLDRSRLRCVGRPPLSVELGVLSLQPLLYALQRGFPAKTHDGEWPGGRYGDLDN
ncbi:uncharacterized protein CC84DRAFT_832303 [Paraphaeosphaeria sporulosa]|uniref:Uncharacterized protein n=1 Tax=Paraphaeosphaeria sporulosa TaxID=1460663 RepID=A0A177CEL1_9PLEO|nr:uncharacterized protein CC84DRAFT_832303 [Paraphaeosphaeria sporulosa]OAG05207.1 hypothetical protein CC84DRAFT_832303 [Paraphaeosphaeria sporulosa]